MGCSKINVLLTSFFVHTSMPCCIRKSPGRRRIFSLSIFMACRIHKKVNIITNAIWTSTGKFLNCSWHIWSGHHSHFAKFRLVKRQLFIFGDHYNSPLVVILSKSFCALQRGRTYTSTQSTHKHKGVWPNVIETRAVKVYCKKTKPMYFPLN